jgi:hypothetical protein
MNKKNEKKFYFRSGLIASVILFGVLFSPGGVIVDAKYIWISVIFFLLYGTTLLTLLVDVKSVLVKGDSRKRFAFVLAMLMFGGCGCLAGYMFSKVLIGHVTKLYASERFEEIVTCKSSNFNRYSGPVNWVVQEDGKILRVEGFERVCPPEVLGFSQRLEIKGRTWFGGMVVESIRKL